MGFWSRVLGRRKSGTVEEWFREFGGGSNSATGVRVTQFTALQATAVMSCVSILSEDVAKMPAHVFQSGPKGGRVIVKDHPLEVLLRKPNNWQDRFEFVEGLVAALLLRGNAYAAIIVDGRGKPSSLVPINPDRVHLYEAGDGSLFYMVTRTGPHETAALQSLPLLIPFERMFHLRWLSQNSLMGVSRISVAREAIGLSIAQQELAARMAGNGAQPGGLLKTASKLDEQVIKRLKADWQEKQGGLANAGKVAVLEQGLEWQQLGMTSVDAQFLESRRFQVEEIARLFRVPGHKIGIQGATAGASMAQADQDYMNNTVSSIVERIEAKLSDVFELGSDGLFVEFDVSRFLRADMQTRFTAYRTGIVGSFMTPNQARRLEGWEDDDSGDVLLQPTNMAPLGWVPPASSSASGPGSDLTGAPGAGGDGDPAKLPEA